MHVVCQAGIGLVGVWNWYCPDIIRAWTLMSELKIRFYTGTYPEEGCADDRSVLKVLLMQGQEISQQLQRDLSPPIARQRGKLRGAADQCNLLTSLYMLPTTRIFMLTSERSFLA